MDLRAALIGYEIAAVESQQAIALICDSAQWLFMAQ